MIGRSIVLQESIDKVTGDAKFAGDYHVADMLHLKVKFSERAHALIKSINVDKAIRYPGVVSVYTARDVPNNRYGLMVRDQPVFCDKIVRYVGDQIAAVVAETPQQAELAASLIEVEYQDLPVLTTPEEAIASKSIPLHAGYPNNLAHTIRLRRGNTAAALKNASVIFEREYFTPMQEHVFLELEAGLAYIDDNNRIVLHTAGQNVHDDQRQIATALEIPLDQVRVVYGAVGGVFGGREDISVQILLALAARKLGRPVKTSWNRGESIRGHCKRHAMTIKHRWGADPDGKITAAEIEILTDAGAYMYTSNSVLECLHSICVGPYYIPNIKLDGKAVFTNNLPGGAFRGYGAPQTAFAAELQISQIAELLGIDPITIRERNCLHDNSSLPTLSILPGKSSLPELIKICAVRSGCKKTKRGWQMPTIEQQHNKYSGFGIALGIKATGYGYGYPEGSEAKIILHGDTTIENAELYTAAVDVGQGSNTVLVQIAAEVLNISTKQIKIFPSDTSLSGDAGATAASRITFFAGNAIKLAAEKALRDWRSKSRPAVGEARWESPATSVPDPTSGACIDNVSYSYAAQSVIVHVDMDTGQVSMDKIIATQDVGRAINPQKIEGQIEGAIVQAMGWTLIENFSTQDGRVISDSLRTYLIPTSMDIPSKVECILIENPDPIGPFGVRGVGEVPFLPLAPATLSAIKDATGYWFNHIPLTPEDILTRIKNKRGQKNLNTVSAE